MFSLAFNVLLFSAFIRSIPVELEESARNGRLHDLADLPEDCAAAAGIDQRHRGLFAFLQSWNDFKMPQLITANLSRRTGAGIVQHSGCSRTTHVVRHATRYGLPPEGRAAARAWLLNGGTSPRLDRGLGLRRARAAIADAGPPRLGVPVPGRGTRPARGPRHSRGTRSRIRSSAGRAARTRAATAAVSRCPGPPSAPRSGSGPAPPTFPTGLVWPAQRGGAGTRSRLDPVALPRRPALAPPPANRGDHGVDSRHRRPSAALLPPGRLAVRHQLRPRARPAAGRAPFSWPAPRPKAASSPPTPPPG